MSESSVYAVWELDYETQNVLSVWTTREAAEAEMERMNDMRGFGFDYEVQEFVLNRKNLAT